MLHEHGYEVHVAARDNLKEKNGLQLDFADRVFDVPFSRSPKSVDNLRAYQQVKIIVEQGNYEIVHCNTPMGGIVTRLACRKVRKKGTKVYYTAHGFHFYQGAPVKNWIFYYPVEQLFSGITDKLITITEEDYQLALRKFHCAAEHIHGVGVDESRYFPVSKEEKNFLKEKMGYQRKQKIILCIGELLPNKNQRMAVRMMTEVIKRYPDTVLLIAGNGPERQKLEQEIRHACLQDHVQLLGYVTNLQDYQRVADVLVSCSRREGLPLNIVEAMLSETPVVATVNRGHRELIRDGETGFLVDIDDAEQMAEKVMIILSDDDFAEEIGKAAKSYVQDYCFSNVKKELEKVYGFYNG